jgi:hypothetical protein
LSVLTHPRDPGGRHQALDLGRRQVLAGAN